MAKKRLLFLAQDFSIGGVTSSLLALLAELDYDRYDVDLATMSEAKEAGRCQLPAGVRLLQPRQPFRLNTTAARLLKILVGVFTGDAFRMLRARRRYGRQAPRYAATIFNQMLAGVNAALCCRMDERYDVAIAYAEMWPTAYLAKKVKAARKLAWVHINYTGSHLAIEMDQDYYDAMDAIVCVSQASLEAFLSVYPRGQGRTTCAENPIPFRQLRQKAALLVETAESWQAYEGFKIVTVGRLEMYTKGLDRCIAAAALLKREGLDFRLYVIGGGKDETACRALIAGNDVEDRVFLLGEKANPYPYMARADLFVLASRHEGKPIVVTEAQVLGTPVLVTEYVGARQQVADGEAGLVIENSGDALVPALAGLIEDSQLLIAMREHLVQKQWSNAEAMTAFAALVEG